MDLGNDPNQPPNGIGVGYEEPNRLRSQSFSNKRHPVHFKLLTQS